MNGHPSFPPIRMRNGTTLVSSDTAAQVRGALVGQMILELRRAMVKGWYIHGHSYKSELASEAVDVFAIGVPQLDAMKFDAWRAVAENGKIADAFALYVMSATIHAAEVLVDMMDDGYRITFGPKA